MYALRQQAAAGRGFVPEELQNSQAEAISPESQGVRPGRPLFYSFMQGLEEKTCLQRNLRIITGATQRKEGPLKW